MQKHLNFILFVLLTCSRLYSCPSNYLDEYFKDSKGLEVNELLGGLSGAKNYKVLNDGKEYVLRILSPKSNIEQRCNEIKAATVAGILGVGPVIYYADSSYEAMIMDFVPGSTVNPEIWNSQENLKTFLHLVKQLHQPNQDFSIGHTLIERTRIQLHTLQTSEIPYPKVAVNNALKKLSLIEEIFKNEPLVPCHNDLNSLNIITDGETFKIIDWADAGFGSFYQDLSGFLLVSGKNAEEQKAVLELYLGYPPSSHELHLLKLMKEVVVLSIFSAASSGFETPIQDEDLRYTRSIELETILWEKELPSIDYYLDLHTQGKLCPDMMMDVSLSALRSFLTD